MCSQKMTRNTTPFLLNLNPSNMHEPGISNNEFLDSLEAIGVWLRVISAYDSLRRFSSPDSTSTQRLASLSNIYLQLGAQLEDQAASLIAFSVWSQDRDLILPDLFSRIFIGRQAKTTDGSQIQSVHEKLKSGDSTRVAVDQRAFFQEVAGMNDAGIVQFFLGYRWRPQPSVRLIPKLHIEVWRNLPGELRRIASSFHEEHHVPRITAAYNKIKHGPQLVIQNPVDRAMKYANSSDLTTQLTQYKSFDKPGVRLLFAGARTRPDPTEGSVGSIAPFLIDDEGAVNKLFFETMVHQANLFSALVKMQIALYRKQRTNWDSLDSGIAQIVEAQGRYMANSPSHSFVTARRLKV